ncbi:hypothetical protein A3H83_04050 [Candidatus Roizmanbacteria bacterium RIFCSPLOWO2_02_FULL_39_8]|nr:MAG: hypothetical protein A3H83_04050 [Candidatus Roizmanbacteria bacterium RIFCSPLOWO2_02_FULL_39_8]
MLNIKNNFPIFKKHQDLVYLDSASSSLKPQSVINAINEYNSSYSVNVHRGLYPLAEKASLEYEETRDVVAKFINAPSKDEIIFTRNATESLNLLGYTLEKELNSQSEIVITIAEHHANFVTWQQVAKKTRATFSLIDIDENTDLDIYRNGKVDLSMYVSSNTKIVALHYISNVLGRVQPLNEIIRSIRAINPHVYIIVDAAQASPHHVIDVRELDCDFLVFSSHKMCGPTGVGVLWGKKALLEKLPPFLFGGDMIDEVFTDHSTFAKAPGKFEAGTPDISGVIGLKTAIEFLTDVGLEKIQEHEMRLAELTIEKMKKVLLEMPQNLSIFLGIHLRKS